MAVTFVGASSSLAASAAQPSIGIVAPACNVDDIHIACVINKALGNVISPPDGTWTQIIQEDNDCTTAADDHRYAIFWKRATASGGTFTFTKATDDNLLFAGAIATFRGCPTSGSPLDATAVARTETVGAADNVSFPAYDPTDTAAHVIFVAFYGNDLTTFAAAMSNDVNPDCTTRFDFESSAGNDCSIALTSGDSDGANIAARTWASSSSADAGNTGVVFALIPSVVAIVGTLAVTPAGDTLSASGDIPVEGTLVVTTASDTLAAAGDVPIAAALALTLANDTLSASGDVPVEGALAVTSAGDTLSSVGTVYEPPLIGTLSVTLAGDAVVAAGQVAIEGALVVTGASDTLASEGNVAIEGALVVTSLGDTLASEGSVPVEGLLAVTATGDTLSAQGDVSIEGVLSTTLSGDSLSAQGYTGEQPILGTLAATLIGDVLAANGAAHISATLNVILQGDVLSTGGVVTGEGILVALPYIEENVPPYLASGKVSPVVTSKTLPELTPLDHPVVYSTYGKPRAMPTSKTLPED